MSTAKDLSSPYNDCVVGDTQIDFNPHSHTVSTAMAKPSPQFKLDVDGSTRCKGDFIIEDGNGNTVNVGDTLKTISERLCIIQPDLEAHERYPALKDAYDQYKMLEKLLMNSNVKKD